jgi:hypothetical protein
MDEQSCGLFAATGGNGLIFRRETSLPVVIQLLKKKIKEKKNKLNHDQQMQYCMEGALEEWYERLCVLMCISVSCKGHFYITPSLYFYHIGYKSSTTGRVQHKAWQCGWRHVSSCFVRLISYSLLLCYLVQQSLIDLQFITKR